MKVENRVAVVTGGGDGMGQQLVVQLLEKGASVAFCDISPSKIAATLKLCEGKRNQNAKVKGFVVDVSDKAKMFEFASQVVDEFRAVHLVFANAGIGAAGALIMDESWDEDEIRLREESFERCFNIDYYGVLFTIKAFLPHIIREDEGYVVLTSSANAFWTWPEHACYTAAKHAVRGLGEALLVETYIKAPHVHVAVVHPGGIKTGIVRNSSEIAEAPRQADISAVDHIFQEKAQLTSAEAAEWILNGVERNDSRILVGFDAIAMDLMVRVGEHKSLDIFKALGKEGVNVWGPENREKLEAQISAISSLGWMRWFVNGGAYFTAFVAPTEVVSKIWRSTGIQPSDMAAAAVVFMVGEKLFSRL